MRKALVIEDNTAIRENVIEILELAGYEVISAVNGKEGIATAKSGNPDIILCDILMPLANGYEVLIELKRIGVVPPAPFIFLTASVERKDIEFGMSLGADLYLKKPFTLEELIEAFEKCGQ
jgi:CheY-like chemotaxis protein